MKKDLIRQLLRAGVHVAVAESFSGDVCGRLKKLKVQASLYFCSLQSLSAVKAAEPHPKLKDYYSLLF